MKEEITKQSDSMDNLDARCFLANTLNLLDKEKPKHIFSTKNKFRAIIRNENGSDVYCGLSEKQIMSLGPFTVSVPGYLNAMMYHGLTIYDNGHIFSGFLDFGKEGILPIGRRAQHDAPIEDIGWGFNVFGQNYKLYPFRDEEDASLIDRVTSVFRKYGTFEQREKKKSRYVKSFYDISNNIRNGICLPGNLRYKLLTD